MRTIAIFLFGLSLCAAGSIHAQTFTECADVDGDGTVNVADMAYSISMFRGGPDFPAGRGDIDFRAGYTLGDFRYLLGYIFIGYAPGGCPPFAPYTMTTTDDSLILPLATITPGSGSLRLPIVFINHLPVTDILVPVEVIGLNDSLIFDSLSLNVPAMFPVISSDWRQGAEGGFVLSFVSGSLQAGTHILAYAFFHYSNLAGGAISLFPGSPNVKTFANYVYGNAATGDYSDLDVGMPSVVITDQFELPSLLLLPDTLVFNTAVGGDDPDPQSFDVLSSGSPFNWTLTKASWLSVNKSSGASGETVTVSPKTSSLTPGTHYAVITVTTDGALGSPGTVTVQVNVEFPYPPMDANCDGYFNLVDLIYIVNYLFRAGPPPCNPCDGAPGAQ